MWCFSNKSNVFFIVFKMRKKEEVKMDNIISHHSVRSLSLLCGNGIILYFFGEGSEKGKG